MPHLLVSYKASDLSGIALRRGGQAAVWVRSELKSKGYIEVDDKTVRHMAEV
jgi:hypothetical protein